MTTSSSLKVGLFLRRGHLLLNSAPNEGDGMDFGFDGTELNYAWYTNTVEIYDASHPVAVGPFTLLVQPGPAHHSVMLPLKVTLIPSLLISLRLIV